MQEIIQQVMSEIDDVIKAVDVSNIEEFTTFFDQSKRVFIDGEGRSGFMAKGFAMRLMHLNYNVFVVGETINPALTPQDVVVVVSGSGESANVVTTARKAKQLGCQVLAVSSKKESTLASFADFVLIVPGAIRTSNENQRKSIQLLSSLFDQSLHIILDVACLYISRRDGISNEKADAKHW